VIRPRGQTHLRRDRHGVLERRQRRAEGGDGGLSFTERTQQLVVESLGGGSSCRERRSLPYTDSATLPSPARPSCGRPYALEEEVLELIEVPPVRRDLVGHGEKLVTHLVARGPVAGQVAVGERSRQDLR